MLVVNIMNAKLENDMKLCLSLLYFPGLSLSEKIGDLETEKGNLVEEVVSLQDKMADMRRDHQTELAKNKERDVSKSSEERQLAELRLKSLGLESDKRKLESEVLTLKEKLAIANVGSGESSMSEILSEIPQVALL